MKTLINRTVVGNGIALKNLALISALISCLVLGACGKKDDNNDADKESTATNTSETTSSETSNSGSNSEGEQMYEAASAVAPRVTPSASVALIEDSTEWQSGNILYEVFGLIREYDDERDNGVIDGSNMFKAMHDGSKQVETAYESCTVGDELAVVPPFDLGIDQLDHVYNCSLETESDEAGNYYQSSFAVNADEEDPKIEALMGWMVDESSSTTRQVLQGQYDLDTEELILNQGYLVSYDNGEKYAVRLHVSGSPETGLFTLKLSKGGGSTSISISGHGYSQGDNHYLFKVSRTEAGVENITDAYFCFASETTEAEMMLMDPTGSATVPADCADYAAGLPEVDLASDGSDAPLNVEDFTGAGDYGITLEW